MASWLKKLVPHYCEHSGCSRKAVQELVTDGRIVMYVCGFHAKRELARAQKREEQLDLPVEKRDS
jgi:hypothetical protein